MNLGSIFGLACAGCRRPESEVGELRIYPPSIRALDAIDDVMRGSKYCGTCAVRKAVRDTLEGRS